jgi:hypothetical protein
MARFQIEYETDEKHDGQMSAVRTRFELNVLGYFQGCSAKIVAAFSFNPRDPGKLTPFDQGKPVSEVCRGPSPMD